MDRHLPNTLFDTRWKEKARDFPAHYLRVAVGKVSVPKRAHEPPFKAGEIEGSGGHFRERSLIVGT